MFCLEIIYNIMTPASWISSQIKTELLQAINFERHFLNFYKSLLWFWAKFEHYFVIYTRNKVHNTWNKLDL